MGKILLDIKERISDGEYPSLDELRKTLIPKLEKFLKDNDYGAEVSAADFKESYKENLQRLHTWAEGQSQLPDFKKGKYQITTHKGRRFIKLVGGNPMAATEEIYLISQDGKRLDGGSINGKDATDSRLNAKEKEFRQMGLLR